MKSTKKRNFSSFTLAEAYKEVKIEELLDWQVNLKTIKPSDYFYENIKRLKVFNLTSNETAKELVIDAFLEESLQAHNNLRAWKEQFIESESLHGIADYLIAKRRDYLDLPFLCIVEAKKDDFEQGLAQCLVEMKVCAEANEKVGKKIDVFGIVTNGETWKFYKLTKGKSHSSRAFISDAPVDLLGMLGYVFTECEKNI